MKKQRIFIHFIKNGRDLGTYGIFKNDKNHIQLQEKLNISGNQENIHLNKETHKIAKQLTGMKL